MAKRDIPAVANAALFRLAQRKPNEGRHRGRPSVSPLSFYRPQHLACSPSSDAVPSSMIAAWPAPSS